MPPPKNPIIAVPDANKDAASTSKDLDLDDGNDNQYFPDAHDYNPAGEQNKGEQKGEQE